MDGTATTTAGTMSGNAFLVATEGIMDLLGSSTQWLVAGSAGAALITRADSGTLVWVLGSLINALFSKALKKGIKQVYSTYVSRTLLGTCRKRALMAVLTSPRVVFLIALTNMPDDHVDRPGSPQVHYTLYALTAVAMQVRPVGARLKDPGMPSSHAMVGWRQRHACTSSRITELMQSRHS